MFTLSTLLLAETVLAQDAPVSPPTQARILQKNNLAMELSGAIAGANLGELKKLGTEKSMTNLKNFVDDKILDKKLGMMEKRLEEGLEKKLEGALSATSAATGPSMEDEEKMIADQVIDQDIEQTFTAAATGLSMEDEEKMMANQIIDQSVDPNVTDPKLIEVEKTLEHKISDTVIDTMAELKIKVAAGEKVSEEEEAQRLEQHITANVLAMFENLPEEKRAALEKAIKESFKKMLANGKRRSLQASFDFTQLLPIAQQAVSIATGPEFQSLFQNILGIFNGGR